MQIRILSNWRVMSHQHKASPRFRFHQTNHLCKVGKIPVVELSPVAFQHYFFHSVFCPIRTILWNLFDRKFLINSNKSPEIDLNLNIKPGIQILSNALDIFKNTAYSFSLHLFRVDWERVCLANQGHFFCRAWQGCSKGSEEEQISILCPFISLQSIF